MTEHLEKLNTIPQALREGDLFAGWCARWDGKRQSKVPVNVQTGRNAHADRSGDWCDFQTTVGALFHNAPVWGFADTPGPPQAAQPLAGIGRLSNYRNDGIIQIDVDNVVEDGQLTAIGREHIERSASYAEFSPSGRGLHIFVRAKLPAWIEDGDISSRKVVQKGDWPDAPKFELQLFISNCYVTMTGDHVASSPLEVMENQDYVDWLLSLERAAPSLCCLTSDGRSVAAGLNTIDPAIWLQAPSPDRVQAVIDNIRLHGKITKQRFEGQIDGNHSRRDFSLCLNLVAWCDQDAALMDAVFRQSKLYRDKWDRMHKNRGLTYGQITIGKAMSSNLVIPAAETFVLHTPCEDPPQPPCEYKAGIVTHQKCYPPPKDLPAPEPLTVEEDLKLCCFGKFRANMARNRQSFLRSQKSDQADRSHVISLVYQARVLGMGPGKALTLILEFQRVHHLDMKVRRGHFWHFWELAGRQLAKTGARTRETIKNAYADRLKRSLNPQTGRRAFGKLAPRASILRRQGFTVREIADELSTTKGTIKDALRRARSYEHREDFRQAVEAIRDQEAGIDVPPSNMPSAVTLVVIEGRCQRGHMMGQDTADFVAAGIQEYCKILKVEPAGSIIASAVKACTKKSKRSVLNAVKNAFARTKAESMPLIGDLAAVYQNVNFEDRWGHFSMHRAVELSVKTLRFVYRETGGDLDAIPRAVLADAVRQAIWPSRALQRIRDWQWYRKMGMDVGSSADEEFAMSAAA